MEDETLLYMLVIMVSLLFPVGYIINSVVADALANPSVSGSLAAPIISSLPILWVVGDIFGILWIIVRWATANR